MNHKTATRLHKLLCICVINFPHLIPFPLTTTHNAIPFREESLHVERVHTKITAYNASFWTHSLSSRRHCCWWFTGFLYFDLGTVSTCIVNYVNIKDTTASALPVKHQAKVTRPAGNYGQLLNVLFFPQLS